MAFSSLLVPSMMKLLLRLNCPPALTPPPPTPVMPGERFASAEKLRPASGRLSSCAFVTVVPSALDVASMSGVPASTVTVSARAATPSVRSMVASWPTVSTSPVRSYGTNPSSAALTAYRPGGSATARYRPRSSVVNSRVSPVSTFDTVTVAPGSTPC